jgi:Cu/Ag efflux pump CusA
MLHAYDEYKPGMGMEVVEWLKDQTRHRQGLERNRTDGSERRLNRSQIFAFVIAMVGLVIAAIASYWSTFVAAVIAIVAVGGPSAASILARLIDPRTGRLPTQPPG